MFFLSSRWLPSQEPSTPAEIRWPCCETVRDFSFTSLHCPRLRERHSESSKTRASISDPIFRRSPAADGNSGKKDLHIRMNKEWIPPVLERFADQARCESASASVEHFRRNRLPSPGGVLRPAHRPKVIAAAAAAAAAAAPAIYEKLVICASHRDG